jgi:hypothetical protein
MKGHFEVHAPYSRDLLRRRNMVLDDYTCAVCKSGSMETLNHLFLQCNFAAQCWATLNLVRNVESDPFNIQNKTACPILHGDNNLDALEYMDG